jgi:uncharacterized damage-inducible protein DinB
MKKGKPDAEIELLLRIIDQSYDHPAWHGTNLRNSLRGISAEEAAWRPSEGRHNIWEIAVHAAYWKYVVRRRLLREKRGSFTLKGSNWFVRPDSGGEREWKKDIALLEETHRTLRKAIARMPRAKLHLRSYGSKLSNAATIYGVASHDVYHAGQVQLIKRLLRKP